jgi:hypothetical protein
MLLRAHRRLVPPTRIVISSGRAESSYPHNLIRRELMQALLSKSLIVSGLALGAALIGGNASAQDGSARDGSAGPDNTLRWQSVIGIAQAGNVVGTGTGAVTGAGVWSAQGGHVKVDLDKGKIDFDVHGLVLAGGNAIGTPGTVLQVKGTLVCDTDGSASGLNSVLKDTPPVNLSDEGDAEFHGSVGALPAVCTSEPDIAFLIRAGTKWIANGTVLR